MNVTISTKSGLWTALVVLALLLLTAISQCHKHVQENESFVSQLDSYKDSTHRWKNKYGELVASTKTVSGTKEQVGKFYNLDSIAKKFDTKVKYLEGYVSVLKHSNEMLAADTAAKTVYQDRPVFIAGKDTCRAVAYMEQPFSNPYYKLSVRVGQGAYARLQVYDTMELTQYKAFKRRFLSKEWYTVTGAKNRNPMDSVQIVGAFQIKDVVKRNYFELRAGVSYWHSPLLSDPLLYGAEAQYTTGRLTFSAQYDRPFVTGKQKDFLIGSVKYTILRL